MQFMASCDAKRSRAFKREYRWEFRFTYQANEKARVVLDLFTVWYHRLDLNSKWTPEWQILLIVDSCFDRKKRNRF